MRQGHQLHHPSGLSERLFIWTELALSGLLTRFQRLRRTSGGTTAAPR